MFDLTSIEQAPWQIVMGNAKRSARPVSMGFVPSRFDRPTKGLTGRKNGFVTQVRIFLLTSVFMRV
jgi:hypothetical protein